MDPADADGSDSARSLKSFQASPERTASLKSLAPPLKKKESPVSTHGDDAKQPVAAIQPLPLPQPELGGLRGNPSSVRATTWQNDVFPDSTADGALGNVVGAAATVHATGLSSNISDGGIDEQGSHIESPKPFPSSDADPDPTASTSLQGTAPSVRATALEGVDPSDPAYNSDVGLDDPSLRGIAPSVRATGLNSVIPSEPAASSEGGLNDVSALSGTAMRYHGSMDDPDVPAIADILEGSAPLVGAVGFDSVYMPDQPAMDTVETDLSVDADAVPGGPSSMPLTTSFAEGPDADDVLHPSFGGLKGNAPKVWASRLDVELPQEPAGSEADQNDNMASSDTNVDGTAKSFAATSFDAPYSPKRIPSHIAVAMAPTVRARGFEIADLPTEPQGVKVKEDEEDALSDENDDDLLGGAPTVQASGFEVSLPEIPPASGPGDHGGLATVAVNLAHKHFVDGPAQPSEDDIDPTTEPEPESDVESEEEPQSDYTYEQEVERRAQVAKEEKPDKLALALAQLRFGGLRANDDPAPDVGESDRGDDDDDDDQPSENKQVETVDAVDAGQLSALDHTAKSQPEKPDWLAEIKFEPSAVEFKFEPRKALPVGPLLGFAMAPTVARTGTKSMSEDMVSPFAKAHRPADLPQPPPLRPDGRDDEIARLLARGTRQRQREQVLQNQQVYTYTDAKVQQSSLKSAYQPLLNSSRPLTPHAAGADQDTETHSEAARETEVLLDAAPGQLRGADPESEKVSQPFWINVRSTHSHVAGSSRGSAIQLREASARGDSVTVERCLAEGVDVNSAPGMTGATPLHAAAERGHTTVVKTLLLRGAKPDATTASGETALDRATYRGHTDCVRALLSHGADPNRVAATGWSPASMATSLQHHSSSRFLQSGAVQLQPTATIMTARRTPSTVTSTRVSSTPVVSTSMSALRGSRRSPTASPRPVSPAALRRKLDYSAAATVMSEGSPSLHANMNE